MPLDEGLIAALNPVQRLALAYAPSQARPAWLAFLALDTRLSALVAGTREVLLGQIKLAWWRDRLAEDAASWPKGEPVLAALAAWHGQHGTLGGLVDGWEAVLTGSETGEAGFAALAEGRGAACAALAGLFGLAAWQNDVVRLGRGWAIAELANWEADPADAQVVFAMAQAQDWHSARLPRAMRPLLVLHGLADRQRRSPQATGISTLFVGMRLGIFGR